MQVQANATSSQAASPNGSGSVPVPSVMNSVPSSSVANPPSTVNSPAPTPPAATLEKEAAEKFDLKPASAKSKAAKKQIPTIIGLLVLFVALISGVLLFGQGTGVFAPRATPETTPKNIRITNVTDKTFTVSFYTDESTVAFVKYGLEADDLDQQASDDRDQLSGIVKDYRLHHITVRGLEAGKAYHYVIGTGSNTFDNEGQPYSLTTAAKPNQSPASNQTVYGNVFTSAGVPAEGAVVYLYSEGITGLSSIVKASGSFGISLSNAFNVAQTAYANLSDESILDIKAQGIDPDLVGNVQTTVALAQPIPDLTLSEDGESSQSEASNSADLIMADKDELLADLDEMASEDMVASDEASMSALGDDVVSDEATDSSSSSLGDLAAAGQDEAPVEEVLDLDDLTEGQEAAAVIINTTTPQIKATLPANTVVRITVHSDTQIDQTMQTDADGNLVLDVASLGQSLEPGEHTATYSYIDPLTGEEVVKTYNFTVAPDATRQLAQANTTPAPTAAPTAAPTSAVPSIPHGSGNPFVPSGGDEELVASPTATITPSPTSTAGATVATDSGQYNSGSLGTTLALLFAGLFFVVTGVWSYFLANSFEVKNRR